MSSFDTEDSMYNTYNLNSNSNLSSTTESTISDTSSSSSVGNSVTDVDSNYDDEIEEIIEDIYFHEEQFLDSEKQDNHYYIGINKVSRDNNYILYANSITIPSFFRYNIKHVGLYLQEYSIFKCNPNIDIMKLFILDDYTYTVVLKTHWLRIIQRHWKNIYLRRKHAIKKRKQLQARMYFEKHGRYPDNSYIIPTLRGMLVSYNTNLFVKRH
jgi:hypothetical protein